LLIEKGTFGGAGGGEGEGDVDGDREVEVGDWDGGLDGG